VTFLRRDEQRVESGGVDKDAHSVKACAR
jgi:hypothetical protein